MWQAHYYLAVQHMHDLETEAARRQRWMLDDARTDRPMAPARLPNPLRAGAARAAAVISRASARFALRLDRRVCVGASPEQLLRDA
jgi:hypothetical protein